MSTSNNLLRGLGTSTRKFVDPVARTRRHALEVPASLLNRSRNDYSLPLLQRIVQIHHERVDGGIFVFTSISQGEGVSFVIESLAWELARKTQEKVLIAPAASLHCVEQSDLCDSENAVDGGPRVWRLGNTWSERDFGPANVGAETLKTLRQWFGYILVDCPALRQSTEVFKLARWSDGAILVVAAGQTEKLEITQAQQLFSVACCDILGLVLNKRTDPIPDFIDKHL